MISEIKDVFDKINKDRYVVGFDLNNRFAQLSYCRIDSTDPDTLSTVAGEEEYNIPAVVLKKKTNSQWVIGRAAEEAFSAGEGYIVSDLLKKALKGDTVRMGNEEYKAEDLLLLFIKRTFAMLPLMTTPDKISAVVITVQKADKDSVRVLGKLPELLNIEADKVHFLSYEESFFFYMLYQKSDLQNHQILLCDSSEGHLTIYRLERNHFVNPAIAGVDVFDYDDFRFGPEGESASEKDRRFLTITEHLLENRICSAVYLIGEGFYDNWCDDSLKFLCKNRRVFKGNNLFSKGAALAAKEYAAPSGYEKTVRFFGKDRIQANVGIVMMDNEESKEELFIRAGEHWYEVGRTKEFLLYETDTVPIWIEQISRRNRMNAEMKLQGLTVKSGRMTRISLTIKMNSEKTILFVAKDLGFGEIYPSTGLEWTEELELEN
ncbi:MAG: hypothetical protein IIZ41_10645 [Lachnospiraceae bacterium]|nr:hypothetical protein [Lachnospiraceae bacterium]MBQ6638956.1 hypothetical protein [Lachnospiraceae bacterium]